MLSTDSAPRPAEGQLNGVQPSGDQPDGRHQRPPAGGPVDVIEVASAVLMRNLELLRRRGDAGGLDRAEYLLLRTLAAIGPSDICTLAAGLGLDPSTAGRQVACMAGKGLVEREASAADRRRTIISPTAQGLDRMHAERERRRAATAELLTGWSDDDLRALGDMFTRYNRAVAAYYLVGSHSESPPDCLAATEALLPRDLN